MEEHMIGQMQPFRHPGRVYCAGPLFNAAERREMEEIAAALHRHGFETFVPHADGMEFAQVRPYLIEKGCCDAQISQLLHEAVFALDVYQVVIGCGALVMNMNGRTPDEGAVAELTMAWMLGKPCVIFKEDARSKIAGRDNPLLVGQTQFQTVSAIDEVGPALADQVSQKAPNVEAVVSCPAHLCQQTTLGEDLWLRLRRLGDQRPSAEVGRIVLDLFSGSQIGESLAEPPAAAPTVMTSH